MPPLSFFMTPLFMPPHNFEMFMQPVFYATLDILIKTKVEIQESISTFLKYFSYSPTFFYATSIYATLEKIEIFMPPPKSLCHPFYATPGVA